MRVIPEADAPKETHILYDQLKQAFQTRTLPLFFAYIGAYPEYLTYITDQIVTNVNNPLFTSLTRLLETETRDMMNNVYRPSKETDEWVYTYKQTSAFYNFQKDLEKNYQTNIKLALIFVALREAIKGWAIATKKLSPNPNQTDQSYNSETAEFVYNQNLPEIISIDKPNQNNLHDNTSNLAIANEAALEKNLLGHYLQLCRKDFEEVIKTEQCLFARVQLEQTLLASIHTFPQMITSPINVVLDLTKKYPDFSELLYLISEHFPTYAVQRLMFSGYMLKNLS